MTIRRKLWLYPILTFFAAFFLLPVYVVIATSLKPLKDVGLETMWALPKAFALENYQLAWEKLGPSVINSFTLVIPAALIAAFLGSMNGFVLSKWKFPGADFVFPLILFGMFIPYQSILIPLVTTLQKLHIYGGIPGLIFVHVVYGIPIMTLIFRNYYQSVPTELIEAARVDGAGMYTTYFRVVLPISIPAFIVAIIWEFTAVWNDFLFAVVTTSSSSWPVTVALNNIAGSQIVQWNVQMAGALIASLPTILVYVLLGRYFLRGLMSGALKG